MSFEHKTFILLMIVVYVAWLFARRRESLAVGLLLVSSLLFYGHNNWRFLPLLLGFCVLNWGIGVWLESTTRRRLALTLGVGFNLIVLSFFKYTPMLVATLAEWTGVRLASADRMATWPLPFGISFYAFTGIAYMVDVYRRTWPAERSLIRYTLSAVFFPHLVAGPILRANEFLTSLRPGAMPTQGEDSLEAAWLLARGYFKKLVLASRVGTMIDPFFAHVADATTDGVWALPYVYLYALQIFLDFSAYTDIARGLGLLFGYRWPDNFDWPYLASNVAEFWRRWHMTLSRFLRDYLYIPLGGSRGGRLRTCVNLMITMLLGGLWHGASWSFLLWGGLHGTFLVGHRLWTETRAAEWLANRRGWMMFAWRTFCIVLTFHCVCLAWCFFRLTVLSESLACVRKWFVFNVHQSVSSALLDPTLPLLLLAYVIASQIVERLDRSARLPAFTAGCRWGLRVGLLILAVLLAPGTSSSPFIYFQF